MVVILALVLRAIVSPLLVATVNLSFAAALGWRLVFDHVFGFAGSDPAFPLWTFVFLVALGTDYNIFLMTRVHEGEPPPHGTRRRVADRPGRHRRGDHLGQDRPRRDTSPPSGPCRWCS